MINIPNVLYWDWGATYYNGRKVSEVVDLIDLKDECVLECRCLWQTNDRYITFYRDPAPFKGEKYSCQGLTFSEMKSRGRRMVERAGWKVVDIETIEKLRLLI